MFSLKHSSPNVISLLELSNVNYANYLSYAHTLPLMIIQTVLKVGRRRLNNLHSRMNLVAILDTTKITFVASIKNRVRGQYRATFKYLRESPYIFLILFTAKSTNQVIFGIQFCNVSIDYLSIPESVHIALYLLSYPLNQKSDHIPLNLLPHYLTYAFICLLTVYSFV